MKRYVAWCLLFTAVVVAGAPLLAHEHFRIIGTVTKLESREIDVKNKDGKTTSMSIDKQTKATRDKAKVPITEVKVGQSVVVDAYGDDEFDLLAVEVRIVPAIAPKTPAKKK